MTGKPLLNNTEYKDLHYHIDMLSKVFVLSSFKGKRPQSLQNVFAEFAGAEVLVSGPTSDIKADWGRAWSSGRRQHKHGFTLPATAVTDSVRLIKVRIDSRCNCIDFEDSELGIRFA